MIIFLKKDSLQELVKGNGFEFFFGDCGHIDLAGFGFLADYFYVMLKLADRDEFLRFSIGGFIFSRG